MALLDAISALKQALGRSPCAAACEQAPGAAALPEDVICKVHLKSFVEEQGLVGYDPNLDVLLGEPHVHSAVTAEGDRLQTVLFPFFQLFLENIRGI